MNVAPVAVPAPVALPVPVPALLPRPVAKEERERMWQVAKGNQIGEISMFKML